ncbi:MAG TPA: diguanylate cyclase, partial [Cystobacter sp.]
MTSHPALSAVLKLPRLAVRAVPIGAVLATFAHLARGGFRSLHSLGWDEAGLVLFLLAGLGVIGWRRFTRDAVGAPIFLQDDLELGSVFLASAFIVVAIAGGELFPLV